MEPEKLEALYFPFSRSIDPSSTKQMLLVFDSIHFLDPVDDESWRAALMDEMVDAKFAGYRAIAEAIPTLVEEGVFIRQDPARFEAIQSVNVVAAAVTDLLDTAWAAVARAPARFGMPHQKAGPLGAATWEVFQEKLPAGFLAALSEVPELQHHVVLHGDSEETWLLSYEAGSAIAMSVHLAAAAELGLATVTDSRMHHHLLLSKMTRSAQLATESGCRAAGAEDQAAQRTAMRLLDDVLPRAALERIGFDELLEFRERTKLARTHFVHELGSRLRAMGVPTAPSDYERMEAGLMLSLGADLREYRADLSSMRDRCWPALAGALSASLPTGGAAAIAMNYLGVAQHAFAAAAVAGTFAFAKGLLEFTASQKNIKSRAAPAVSYLSQVKEAFGA